MKVSGQESRQDSSDVFRDLDRSTAHVLRALEDFPMTDVFFSHFFPELSMKEIPTRRAHRALSKQSLQNAPRFGRPRP